MFRSLLISVGLVLGAGGALGDEPDVASQARAAKARGDAAMDQGKGQDALEAYEEAYRLQPAPALLYNRARACELLGRYAAALTLLERFATEADSELKARVPALGELLRTYRSRTVQLFLDVEPDRAEVMLDGQPLGVSPLPQPIIVEAGVSAITAGGLTDFYPATRTVTLPAGSPVHVTMVLMSRLRGGVLRVTAPEGAEVTVDDGLAAGPAPLESVVIPGPHSVKVSKAGFDTLVTSVLVKAGELRLLETELKPEPTLWQRWYFWTAIGVVVAGIVATSVALAIERPPPYGSLNDPSRPLPVPHF